MGKRTSAEFGKEIDSKSDEWVEIAKAAMPTGRTVTLINREFFRDVNKSRGLAKEFGYELELEWNERGEQAGLNPATRR